VNAAEMILTTGLQTRDRNRAAKSGWSVERVKRNSWEGKGELKGFALALSLATWKLGWEGGLASLVEVV